MAGLQVIRSEFIFGDEKGAPWKGEVPFQGCHAATIAETPQGLVAAFFAGSHEGHPDVGIWLSRRGPEGWSAVEQVADGANGPDQRYPCWNPVLYQPQPGLLWLFYKVGPDPESWWGMWTTSQDDGRSWSPPQRLPPGIWGPIKNKPVPGSRQGEVLCPTSSEAGGWRAFVQRTADLGQTWQTIGPLNDVAAMPAIQPTILSYPDGRMQLLCRSAIGCLTTCWSEDGGGSWSPMQATSLPNPNSGIDGVSLKDGRALLVYNHAGKKAGEWGGERTPLNVALSADGEHWEAALVLEHEPGEYSYPAVIQASGDGHVHIVYTWRRERIKHVVIDPACLETTPIVDGRWPRPGP
jgi:predicted neuraminidase